MENILSPPPSTALLSSSLVYSPGRLPLSISVTFFFFFICCRLLPTLWIRLHNTEFDVDIDGKRYLWKGKVILPFIDEKRPLASTTKAKEDLKEYKEERNSLKSDLLCVIASSNFGHQILSKIDKNSSIGNGVGGLVNVNLHTLDYIEGDMTCWLYMTKQDDVFGVTQRRSEQTTFRFFTGFLLLVVRLILPFVFVIVPTRGALRSKARPKL